ncbi:MAG: right-handed parallel beta-helix repeat-containing protein [bacterium]
MKTKIQSIITVIIFLVLNDSIFGQTIIYVDASVSGGSNNGSSWANAYTSLQTALTAAVSTNQIWVANGTYKPTTEVGGIGDRYKAFQMKNGVAIYGGFASGEDEITDRVNYGVGQANETILSGDIGTVGLNTDNCYHVIYNSNGLTLTTATILDGFTISGGYANHDTNNLFFCGGGMLNYSCSPTIINCTFVNNTAVNGGGGGIFNYLSSPAISNCTFNQNSAPTGGGISNFINSSSAITNCVFNSNSANYGGGMQNYSSSSTITDCTFNSNTASSNGGGMENEDSSPTLTNCTFSSNTASANGGGIENDNSSPTIINCTFSGNTASTVNGGGIYNINGSSPAVRECIFRSNSAGLYGGAIQNNNSSSPVITNCLFNGNTANCGGGIDNRASSPTLTNCTFGGNSVVNLGGAICNDATSAPTVKNDILWGNFKIGDLSVSEIYGGTASNFTYSCIQGGSGTYTGTGNIFINPAFVDANGVDNIYGTSDDNFSLRNSSPCIGTATASGAPATDIIGNARGNPPDMGAYENSLNAQEIKIIYVKADAVGSNTGTSWDDAYTSLQSALNEALMHNQIWVAKGTYKPSSPYDLTVDGDRDFHFRMINDVVIYGGFAGTEANIDQRVNYDAGQVNETILSGDIGSIGVKSDNCYHIFYHPGVLSLNSTAKLDGFTISGGYADYVNGIDNTHACGSAMYNYNSSPAISNCSLSGNEASRNGGGIYNEGNSLPLITNCSLTGNTANNGGGVYNDHSSLTLSNCYFSSNNSSLGAGIHNYYSSPAITNCTFNDNTSYEGGGIFNDNSSPTTTNCLFTGNTATFGGGMFNLNSSNSTLINCTFSLNNANDYGGGIQIDYTSSSVLQNCILWGNTADDGGKQIYANDGSATLYNCCYANGAGDVVTNGTGTVTPNSCINSNPDFVNPGSDDFRITGQSSCLDLGNNSYNSQTNDIRGTGHPRKLNKETGAAGTIDIGAYEYELNIDPLPVELISFAANIFDGKVILNWQTATEVNNYGFEVERIPLNPPLIKGDAALAEGDWKTLGFVEGNGNSNSPKEYSFTDNLVLIHDLNRVQYRLKQIDIDGSFTYSQEVEVNAKAEDIPTTFELLQNYPNPFNPTTAISWQLAAGSKTQIKIYDVLGREVATLVDEYLPAGSYAREWNASELPSGIYFCRMEVGSYKSSIKLLLLK